MASRERRLTQSVREEMEAGQSQVQLPFTGAKRHEAAGGKRHRNKHGKQRTQRKTSVIGVSTAALKPQPQVQESTAKAAAAGGASYFGSPVSPWVLLPEKNEKQAYEKCTNLLKLKCTCK